MRFIRRHGRVIPIREKGDAAHGKFAAAGAVGRVASAAAPKQNVFISFGKSAKGFNIRRPTPGSAAALGIFSLGVMGANLVNSYQHGVKEKSFLSGAGRYVTNGLAGVVGAFGASSILKLGRRAGLGIKSGAIKKPKAKINLSKVVDTTFKRL